MTAKEMAEHDEVIDFTALQDEHFLGCRGFFSHRERKVKSSNLIYELYDITFHYMSFS